MMIFRNQNRRRIAQRGVAMVIVMVTILVLGAMAASLSYSMKVEMTLAYNSNLEPELEWIARSGVEYARYVLALQAGVVATSEPYDSLNQVWAGGPGSFLDSYSDDPLAGISLKNYELGAGRFSLTITDCESRYNINVAQQNVLMRAMEIMGVDSSVASEVVDSILDWRDADSEPRFSGAELDDYLREDPPYFCKDGPIDDLTEMLQIRGVTPELFWGPQLYEKNPGMVDAADGEFLPLYPVGLVDLFSPFGEQAINVNTASVYVLSLIPGFDENYALSVIQQRVGDDTMDGTEDDLPFATAMELPLPPEINQAVSQFMAVRSTHFEVKVEASIGTMKKEYIAYLRRNGPTSIDLLSMHEL